MNRRAWIRPAKYKIADKATLEQILNPPPKPPPEFQGSEYVSGIKQETNVLYACSEPNCTAKFTTPISLTLHFNKHLNRNLRCSFCKLLFKTEEDLSHHKTTFHPDLDKNPDANPLQCQKCKRICRNTRALWRHVRETHNNKTYPCPHCDFPFKYPENLKEHLRVKHADLGYQPAETFPCQYCPRTFVYKNSLQSHVRSNHRELKTFRCVICDTVYTNVVVYKHHMKEHCQPKYIRCELCNVTFSCNNHLRRHMESNRHKLAAKSFKQKTPNAKLPKIVDVKSVINPNLTSHELIELCLKTQVRVSLHRVDQRIMNMSVAKKFRRMPKLQNTESRDDSAEETYSCMYCEAPFSNVSAVATHEKICLMRMRSRKLCMCPTCDKEFDYAYKLKEHCRLHTEERPFPCSYWPVKFKTKVTKAQHERVVHFGILPPSYNLQGQKFPCKEAGCGKVYSRPEVLRRHRIAVHVGTRFPCEKCGRVYKEKKSYRKHIIRDHAECPIRLKCKPCKRTYKDKKTYLDHLARKRHLVRTGQIEEDGDPVDTKLEDDSDES